MARFYLLDEYTSIVQPGYEPQRPDVSETAGREYGTSLVALAVLALGAVPMLASLRGLSPTDPTPGFEVADFANK